MDALGIHTQELNHLASRHSALSGHLRAFYEEIEKLAKGKSLVPATDLIVERCNEVIRDAKAIVVGDLYLDRVKEFVSAGDNPVYPDILITTRTVLESLDRSEEAIKQQREQTAFLVRQAKTIRVATELFLEHDSVPSKEDVESKLGEHVSQAWFVEDEDGEKHFDFDRLDGCVIEEYFGIDGTN